ncbi:hypothetical protein BJV78DRAFT_1151098 [Lactifluus subvellereus]|nr:hypothetical protein BJV78DRAFT_1151098 [Lactifluus subvellereus]
MTGMGNVSTGEAEKPTLLSTGKQVTHEAPRGNDRTLLLANPIIHSNVQSDRGSFATITHHYDTQLMGGISLVYTPPMGVDVSSRGAGRLDRRVRSGRSCGIGWLVLPALPFGVRGDKEGRRKGGIWTTILIVMGPKHKAAASSIIRNNTGTCRKPYREEGQRCKKFATVTDPKSKFDGKWG